MTMKWSSEDEGRSLWDRDILVRCFLELAYFLFETIMSAFYDMKSPEVSHKILLTSDE